MEVILGAVFLVCAAFFFFIAPRSSRRDQWPAAFFRYSFAHRGLYGEGIPENSLAAFNLAAESGYGIELDVQFTGDGALVVHHDPTLKRSCGVDRAIRNISVGEIKRYSLGSSGERVPTFSEALNSIRGRVPLIVELKTAGKRNAELARKAYDQLRRYRGDWIVESFDPRLMRWFRKNAPQAIRGQLAYDPRLGGPPGNGAIYWLGANLLMNWISRPDFVAYGYETDRNLCFRIMKTVFRPVLAAWTVRSAEEFQRLKNQYHLQIFEGFLP